MTISAVIFVLGAAHLLALLAVLVEQLVRLRCRITSDRRMTEL